MQHSFRIILSLSMFFVHRLIINNDRCDPSSRYVVSLLGGRKKLESNSLEETRSRGKVGRGLNFPVFPLVAIHDWAEKSQSCRGTSLRGGEELPEVYYPLGFSGRTFKPSRLFSKRKASDAIVRSLLRRGRYSIVMSTLSFSLPLSPSLFLPLASVFMSSRNSLKLYRVTRLLTPFSRPLLFQYFPLCLSGQCTSTYRINETTLSSNLSSIEYR